MLPSLRGTISGSGPAPEASVILKLMAENRESWDPAFARDDRVVTDVPQDDASMEPDSTARKYDVERALGQDEFRDFDPRIAVAKVVGAVDTWRKASSHFKRAIPVADVIAAQPGMGTEVADGILEELSIEPESKLDELTEEQLGRLVRRLAVRAI
jgi:hypothetical protein